jgi:hypothetical protein
MQPLITGEADLELDWWPGRLDLHNSWLSIPLSFQPRAGTNGWCWGQSEAEAQIVLETHANVYRLGLMTRIILLRHYLNFIANNGVLSEVHC